MEVKETGLSEERKTQIITAAMKEFAEVGYEKASTNKIIQEAGVAKGLLFHYFGSKKNLYLETLDICLDTFLVYFDQRLEHISNDYIDRIIEINKLKIKLAAEKPLMQQIIAHAFLDPAPQLREELIKRQKRIYEKYMPFLQTGIDKDLFKPDIDLLKAMDLVLIVANALGDKYIKIFKDTQLNCEELLTGFINELEIYLNFLKNGIYKGGTKND